MELVEGDDAELMKQDIFEQLAVSVVRANARGVARRLVVRVTVDAARHRHPCAAAELLGDSPYRVSHWELSRILLLRQARLQNSGTIDFCTRLDRRTGGSIGAGGISDCQVGRARCAVALPGLSIDNPSSGGLAATFIAGSLCLALLCSIWQRESRLRRFSNERK